MSVALSATEVQDRATLAGALSPASERPLDARRILVTAPRQYAAKLTSLLVSAGARPLWTPTIEITALDSASDAAALDATLARLSDFSHVAFTSQNGIRACLARLEALHGADAAPAALAAAGVRVCALGADGAALRSAGYPVHVLPEEASTQGLVRELVARGEAAGARVLCPVPHVTGGLDEPPVVPRFVAALEAAGADATRVPAYVTRPGVSADDIAAEAALMRGGCVDAILFTSTAEAQGLVDALGGTDVLTSLVGETGIVLAAHGPYTAAGVSEVTDLEVGVIGTAFGSFHGVVSALADHFGAQAAQSK